MAGFDLGKMIGPLPLGAWIAAVGGSLGLAVVLNKQGGDDEPATVLDVSGTIPSTAEGPEAIYVVDRSNPGGTAPAAKGAFESNNEWRLYVSTNLVGRGFDAGKVDGALNRYLRGDDCQLGDAQIISAALAIAFPPDAAPTRPPCPTAVTPGPSTPAPVPTPTPPAPPPAPSPTPTPQPAPPPPSPAPAPTLPSITYTVVRDDTLSEIAQRFYGSGTRTVYMALYNHNAPAFAYLAQLTGKAPDPDYITPGMTLQIPGTLAGRNRR